MKGRDLDDDLPSFRATDDPEPVLEREEGLRTGRTGSEPIRSPLRPEPARSGNGPLWALCAALTLALIGFGYWSHQQQNELRQLLVETQNSFARISEDAAGRMQDITGKVSATESSLSEAEQARAEQLERLQKQVTELTRRVETQAASLTAAEQSERSIAARVEKQEAAQQQLGEQMSGYRERSEALDQRLAEGDKTLASLQQSLASVTGDLGTLAELEQQLAQQTRATASLQSRVEELAEQRQSVNLDQELLVLRSEIDQRLSNTQDALDAIDSFRVQVNRNINTLQNQLSNLQQQVSAQR